MPRSESSVQAAPIRDALGEPDGRVAMAIMLDAVHELVQDHAAQLVSELVDDGAVARVVAAQGGRLVGDVADTEMLARERRRVLSVRDAIAVV